MPRPHPEDSAIARTGRRFLDLSLPKAEWTHAAHFSTTLWLLRDRPDIQPERDMPNLIRRYNESIGGVNSDTAGYHETITQASIAGARAFLASQSAEAPLGALVTKLLASPLGDKDWPLAYWSRENLFSPAARIGWLAPDLAPLPWPVAS
jgi:hypothetical protein